MEKPTKKISRVKTFLRKNMRENGKDRVVSRERDSETETNRNGKRERCRNILMQRADSARPSNG